MTEAFLRSMACVYSSKIIKPKRDHKTSQYQLFTIRSYPMNHSITSITKSLLVALTIVMCAGLNLQAQTNNPAPYCAAVNTPSGVCGTYFIGIGAVRIKNGSNVLLNNTTDCTPGGTGTNEYTYFNNLPPVLLSPGQSYTWEVQPLAAMTTGYTNQLSIWIDWNADNVLNDASPELIYSGGQLGPGTTLSGSFTVPSSAVGSLRMRLRTMNSGTMTSCGTVNYGETEDYALSTGYNNDLAVNSITTTTAIPFPAGLNTINANVTNAGGNAINTCVLSYTIVPSVGAPISGSTTYSSAIAVGATATIPIYANYPFASVGSVTVTASVSTVNNTTDGNPVNNSASRLLGAGLNGTYTIGGTAPDFTSLTQAASQLNAGGTIGPVTFNIRSGTYTENVYLGNIPGNTSTKPILFQSENGNKNTVILQFSNVPATGVTLTQISGTTSIGGTPTLRMNNADYVSFRNFTISALNNASSSGTAIELIGAVGGSSGCDNILFDNMVFNGAATTSTAIGDGFFVSSNSGYHPNLVISNCTFNQASIPIYHVYSGSTMPAGIQIMNNTFTNFGSYGMILQGTDGAIVQGNTLTASSVSISAGVSLVNHNGAFNFRKNRLNFTVNNGASAVISGTRTATAQAVFANNFIRVAGTSGVCMNATSSSGVGIYHNTLYNSTTNAVFNATSGTAISLTNNIFYNAGGGVALNIGSGVTSDYNDLYSTGATLGIWNGTSRTTIALWRSFSGQDLNSSNVAVVFASPTTNNLSLTTVDPSLYGIGSTSNGTFSIGIRGTVPDDIFGNGRNRSEVFVGAHQLIPVITFNPAPPAGFTGCANQTLVISANAAVTYNAQLSFSWQRNGSPLLDGVNGVSGANTGTLTITGAQPSLNGGDYVLRVTATGGADPLVSDIISVVINAPIVIAQQPASRIICLGNETSIAVVASGTVLRYQWQKDGKDICGATSPIYVISNAGFGVSGKYRCVMFGTCGTNSVFSNDAVVYVASNTLISEGPKINGAAIGSTGYLDVQVDATAQIPGYSPQYQWYQGTTALADNGRISGSTTNQLTIRNMTSADITKDYTCTVTGVCGAQTSNAGGFYVSQISIQNQPQAQEVCVGKDASLLVSASSNIPNVQYSYQWKMNNVAINDGPMYSGTKTSVLTIKAAGIGSAGDYSCLVTANPTGANLNSNTATISVISSPTIGTQPQSQSVCVGQALQVSVAATGGTLGYQWKANGIVIPGATESTFAMAGATESMNGAKVTCDISNNCGSVVTTEATITVNDKPLISVQPSNSAVAVGSNFTMSVVASNAVSYQWKKDGAAIPGATDSRYVVQNFTSVMAGRYNCEVTNACGTTTSDAAVLTVSSTEDDAIAAGFSLSDAQPTPTLDVASIRFNMPVSAAARVSVYDVFGREVAVIFNGTANTGENRATLNALGLSNGVYTYSLSSGNFRLSRKLVVNH